MRARALACIAAVAPVLAASPAHTQPARASGVVVITVLGSPEDLERIRASIAPGDFGGAPTRWRLQDRWDAGELLRAKPEGDAGVRCWVDVSEQGRARLYFADAARERFLLRDVPLSEGLSDLGRESLAQVLAMSVTALLEDARAGMTRSEAARILAERAPERRSASRQAPDPEVGPEPRTERNETGLELRASYSGRLYSNEVSLVHGPGLALVWTTGRGPFGANLSASLGYELPAEISARWVGLEWQTTTLRGSVDLTRRAAHGSSYGYARLGGGVDLVRLQPRRGADEADLETTAARTSPEAVATAALGACTRFGSTFGACAHVSADFYPVRVHYDVRNGDATTRVFAPWRYRPGLTLALLVR